VPVCSRSVSVVYVSKCVCVCVCMCVYVYACATGGLAHDATIFYKCLASLLSTTVSGGIVMPSLWAGFTVAYPFPC